MTLVRTVSSAKFICCCWRNPWCDCHVIHQWHRQKISEGGTSFVTIVWRHKSTLGRPF